MNVIKKIIYTMPLLLFPVIAFAASRPRTLVELINRFVETKMHFGISPDSNT